MSKNQTARALRKEISKVNEQIDELIVQGRSYNGLARHHKMLVARLRRVGAEEPIGLSRFAHALASFMF